MQEDWAQNRADVGLAILGLAWAGVFASAGAMAGGDGPWPVLAGFASLVALIALTRIGMRLAFGAGSAAVLALVALGALVVLVVAGIVIAAID